VPVRFPFFGVRSTVSGVGYNVSKALTMLGDTVRLVSLIGHDIQGTMVRRSLAADGMGDDWVVSSLEQTAQSAILYDPQGRRQINVDLKDIQNRAYPQALFEQALAPCSVAVLCNINFSRPFLALARRQHKLVATDVHTIAQLDDPYNQDFMQAAHVLFMSDEALPCAPETWVKRVWNRYGNEIVVVGLGAQGALLAVKEDGFLERVPAVHTREVVNTIGAGDALFSTFVHFYQADRDPYAAIQKAVVMASYKIGQAGAAEGLLDQRSLLDLCVELGIG
jgi:ribokinase